MGHRIMETGVYTAADEVLLVLSTNRIGMIASRLAPGMVDAGKAARRMFCFFMPIVANSMRKTWGHPMKTAE